LKSSSKILVIAYGVFKSNPRRPKLLPIVLKIDFISFEYYYKDASLISPWFVIFS